MMFQIPQVMVTVVLMMVVVFEVVVLFALSMRGFVVVELEGEVIIHQLFALSAFQNLCKYLVMGGAKKLRKKVLKY